MPTTAVDLRLRQLVHRIRVLREQFVPPYDPVGNYTPEQHDCIRAFLLLSHAAFERYFEDICDALVQNACQLWHADQQPRETIISLLAFAGDSVGDPPSAHTLGPSGVRATVESARIRFGNRVFSNNGIRTKDLLALLLPAGVREFEIDSTWLASVDAFGGTRGVHAHAAPAAQVAPDAKDVVDQVTAIIAGLRRLNKRFRNLL